VLLGFSGKRSILHPFLHRGRSKYRLSGIVPQVDQNNATRRVSKPSRRCRDTRISLLTHMFDGHMQNHKTSTDHMFAPPTQAGKSRGMCHKSADHMSVPPAGWEPRSLGNSISHAATKITEVIR